MDQKNNTAFELAAVRKEILTYCEPLPQIIKAHGPASLGSVALSLGKCFSWIGPSLDQHCLLQPLPGAPFPTVCALGEELRRLDRLICLPDSERAVFERVGLPYL